MTIWRHYINKNIMKNLWNQKQYYPITIVVLDPCLISFNEQLVEVMGNLCACLIVCRMWAIVCVCVFQSWNIKSNETIIRFSLSLALSLLYSHMSHGKMKTHTREKHLWRDEMTNHSVFFFIVFTWNKMYLALKYSCKKG